jgi:hypothetical protein
LDTKINLISNELNIVEAVTQKNTYDIAKLTVAK